MLSSAPAKNELSRYTFYRAHLGGRALHGVRVLSDLEGFRFRGSDAGRTKVGRKSHKSEFGPLVGPSSDSWICLYPLQFGGRTLHAVRMKSDLEGFRFRGSDVRRTKVGRKSQKSEFGPSVGPSSDTWVFLSKSRPT